MQTHGDSDLQIAAEFARPSTSQSTSNFDRLYDKFIPDSSTRRQSKVNTMGGQQHRPRTPQAYCQPSDFRDHSQDGSSLTNFSPATSISLKTSSSTSGSRMKDDSGIHTPPSLLSGSNKYSKSAVDPEDSAITDIGCSQIDTSTTSLLPTKSIDNLRTNMSSKSYTKPGACSSSINRACAVSTHHDSKGGSSSLLRSLPAPSSSYDSSKQRNFINKTNSFDKEQQQQQQHLRQTHCKIPFTGSVATRDPPFYYATICRGYSSRNEVDPCSSATPATDKINLARNASALQRGNSSHELLVDSTSRDGCPSSPRSPDSTSVLLQELTASKGTKLHHSSLKSSLKKQPNQPEKNLTSQENPIQLSSPLQSVVDLPKVVSGAQRYYTLKISNTRHNSESFV